MVPPVVVVTIDFIFVIGHAVVGWPVSAIGL